jgi:uncharacterized membrane protein (DUF106 family)
MSLPENEDALSLLREIRDQQRLALERQAEALAMQREHHELARRQFERAERLQERAEQLQARSASVVNLSRKMMWIVLPLIVIAIAYLSWIIFFRGILR